MMNQLLTRERYADVPTVRVQAIPRPLADEIMTARLYGMDAAEARAAMLPGETPDMLFLRLWLFYRHANRQDSDTALVAAIGRAESEARR